MKIVKIVSHAPYVSSYVVENVTARPKPGMAFTAKDGAVFYLQEIRETMSFKNGECTGGQIEVGFAPSGGAGTRELVVGDELEAVGKKS